MKLALTLLFLINNNSVANLFDPMDLKQILSLHLDGLSNRKIAIAFYRYSWVALYCWSPVSAEAVLLLRNHQVRMLGLQNFFSNRKGFLIGF
jgi:hypothetical protein